MSDTKAQAWVLTEGRTGQHEGEIVGIALTNESASAWVGQDRRDPGWRRSAPYPIIPIPRTPCQCDWCVSNRHD